MSRQTDVVIIGGGVVGITLASALGLQGRQVVVVEAREPVAFKPDDEYDLRVFAVSPGSQAIFTALGVWPMISARRISPYRHMHVWDAGGNGQIDFDCLDVGEPRLGHIIENRVLQDALLQRLHELPNVQWCCPDSLADFEVADCGVEVRLQSGSAYSASLLVGADGAASRVRQHAGFLYQKRAYEQQAIVANITTALPHQHTAWQRFLPSGPLAFLPLADGSISIVWSTTQADRLLTLDDTAFCEALAEAFDYKLGEVTSSTPRVAFALAGGQAEPYVGERIALVGDAAHSIHPLAGQGANLGITDAAVLAQVLGSSTRDMGGLRTLRRYERARKGENILMMRAMEGFKTLFGSASSPITQLRNTGLSLTNNLPAAKRMLMRHAMGLSGERPQLIRHTSV